MEDNLNPMEQDLGATENPIQNETNTCECGEKKKKKCCHTGICILNIVLLLGLVALYALHFTGIASNMIKTKGKPAPAAVEIGDQGNLRIAWINTDTLMAKYQYAKDLEKQLQDFQTAKRNSYISQMQQFENDYNNYIHGGADKMTLEQQQNKEKELQNRAAKLQTLQDDLALQVQEKTLAESEKMTNAVYNFIREYNENLEQPFDFILARSFSSSPLLYGNPNYDLTNVIVEGLNAEYARVQANKDN